MSVTDPNYQDCPDGLFSLTCEGTGTIRDCARFRQLDASGQLTDDVSATSGAVQTTDNGTSCTIELEIAFPGGTFQGSAEVAYSSVEPGPFCLQ